MEKEKDKYVGYHDDLDIPFSQGEQVIIPQGARCYSTQKGQFLSKRKQIIKIDHLLTGSSKSNPSVRWAGSGGYWVECDVNDVLPLKE